MKALSAVVLSLFLFFPSACKWESATPPTPMPQATTQPAPMVRAKSNPQARVLIQEPTNGQTVSSPVTVKFGLEGMELAPAGEVKDGSGHHHLLVDQTALPPMDQPLPFSDQILHFGQAQTEASINLSPGTHTLQLVFADGKHIPHDPPVISEKITVQVK